MAQPLEVSKLDGFFLLRRERSHQGANALRAPFFVELLLVIRRDDGGRQIVGRIFAAALALAFQAQVIEGAIARHGAQPGEERTASGVVSIGVTPELEKDVLHDFLGGGGVLDDAQNQAVDEARVAIIELFKGAHVFFEKAQQERRIWRHFARTTRCESRQEHESRLLPLLRRYTKQWGEWMSFDPRAAPAEWPIKQPTARGLQLTDNIAEPFQGSQLRVQRQSKEPRAVRLRRRTLQESALNSSRSSRADFD